MNYFIRDCNDKIVGNPKGYRTMRGAIQQQNMKGSPAWRAIWSAFEERKKTDPSQRQICWIGTWEAEA